MSGTPRLLRLLMELRSAGITDARVLGALERVPREQFVPATFADQAYEDRALPIGHGQTLSQPRVVATMLAALSVGDRMKVLEVGTGSGYQTAILALLARRVYTIERFPGLLRQAETRLAALRVHNVTVLHGDGALGWPKQAPFERIVLSAAAEDVPPVLYGQLADGGVMVLPIGEPGRDQELVRVVRTSAGPQLEALGPVRFVPLLGGAAEADG